MCRHLSTSCDTKDSATSSLPLTSDMKAEISRRFLRASVVNRRLRVMRRLCPRAAAPDFRAHAARPHPPYWRTAEHTSELQALMDIRYAVFRLKNKHLYAV